MRGTMCGEGPPSLPFWDLPQSLTVGGAAYPIDWDFRAGIRVRQMFSDPYLTARPTKLFSCIRDLLFFGAQIPECDEMAWLLPVLWYLTDGRMSPGRLHERLVRRQALSADIREGGGEEVFSYLWDMPYVYAAFLSVYRIDLCSAKLHLWQFDALFDALDADCAVRRISALRAMSVGEVCEEMRPQLAAEKLAVRIPDREELYRAALARAGHCSFARSETVARPDDSRTADIPPPIPHGCVSADALQPNFDPIKEEQHHANT